MLVVAALCLGLSLVQAVVGPDALEGLPGQIINKFRENRYAQTIDLLEELQGSYEWANTQPEWSEFSFPVDQTVPVPMIGDVHLHVQSMAFTQFDASRERGAPIVQRTDYGYRLGLFNIGVQLDGIEITTSGFFSSSHKGTLKIDLEGCFLDIELLNGQLIPRVTGKIGTSQYSFSSPSIMTELLLTPCLMISEGIMNETIETAFAYYLTQFWLPVDMEFYIAVAADAFLEEEDSATGAVKQIDSIEFSQIEAEASEHKDEAESY